MIANHSRSIDRWIVHRLTRAAITPMPAPRRAQCSQPITKLMSLIVAVVDGSLAPSHHQRGAPHRRRTI
jgi:hypothetical protein